MTTHTRSVLTPRQHSKPKDATSNLGRLKGLQAQALTVGSDLGLGLYYIQQQMQARRIQIEQIDQTISFQGDHYASEAYHTDFFEGLELGYKPMEAATPWHPWQQTSGRVQGRFLTGFILMMRLCLRNACGIITKKDHDHSPTGPYSQQPYSSRLLLLIRPASV